MLSHSIKLSKSRLSYTDMIPIVAFTETKDETHVYIRSIDLHSRTALKIRNKRNNSPEFVYERYLGTESATSLANFQDI